MSTKAKLFIASTAVLGLALLLSSLRPWVMQDPVKFAAYLGLALIASGLKVVLPGTNSTMSVTFYFILLGTLELSPGETMVLGCASTLVQCFWKMNRPAKPVRLLFNVL